MSKINKLITNKPVTLTEEEVTNLSKTLSAVQTAGGGGGGGGRVYYGDNATISVNQVDGIISLTTDATEKLNTPIPTKVLDLTDHEDYQTTAGMSSYLTTGDAASTYQPKGDYLSANALADYYQKTETSGASELNTAFGSKQDNLTQEQLSAISSVSSIKETVLAGDANIRTTSAEEGNTIKWTLELTAQPTVTDTTLSGYSGIVATKDANVSSQWNVGLSQAIINSIDGKLDTTAAAETYQTIAGMDDYYLKTETSGKTELSTEFAKYQPKGNYLVADDITGKLDKSIYANASGNWENTYNIVNQYSAAGTWLTAHQSLSSYYQKSETSGANELATEFAKYVTSSNVTSQDTDYVMTTNGWKVLTLPGGGMTQVIHDATLTGQGNANDSKLGVAWSALSGNVSSKLDTTAAAQTYQPLGDYYSASNPNNYVNESYITSILAGYAEWEDFENLSADVQNKLYASAAAQTYLTTAIYAVDSATFLTKSSADNDYAPKSITATVNTLTAASAGWNNKVDKPTELVNQYLVLRTDDEGNVSGWCDFQDQSYSKSEADRTFVATAYIDTTTLSGNGKSVSTKLGVKTDVIATTDYVNSSFLPLSGGTVSGKLTVSASDFFALEMQRSDRTSTGTVGINGAGGMSFKVTDANSNNTQLNIAPNATMDKRFSIGDSPYSPAAYFIPAVTATTTAGLTDDGILHIIVEN